ncbi:isocitrate/isopropylmalate family dehydrogenase [Sinobaca sp. H24]|uniref:isocitrate/isopropylmalate family dehydrogenase n=1 Tax=Sinobaca sp. H24 TaxID=2923376 RepID=UPI00207A3957|nr:isocitrate/isopropylmalate family dehydrogenase [Sinobaca sp. H24]
MRLNLAIMNGDDIGHEIVPATVDIMKKAIMNFNDVHISWNDLPIGYTSLIDYGETLTDETLKTLDEMDGWILGPIGHAAYPKNDPDAIKPSPNY